MAPDGFLFFRFGLVGLVPDGGHHGDGERDMPEPVMPGSGFVMIEPELALIGPETILDENGIERHLIKIKCPWTNGQVERMTEPSRKPPSNDAPMTAMKNSNATGQNSSTPTISADA